MSFFGILGVFYTLSIRGATLIECVVYAKGEREY